MGKDDQLGSFHTIFIYNFALYKYHQLLWSLINFFKFGLLGGTDKVSGASFCEMRQFFMDCSATPDFSCSLRIFLSFLTVAHHSELLQCAELTADQ